jgi:cyclic pyranopterin monophosphate synthase
LEDKVFSHFDAQGKISMVDVSSKEETLRLAVAGAKVIMQPATLQAIKQGEISKGEVLATAKLAGIMAAKQTPVLIPLCHPLLLSHIEVRFNFAGVDTLEIEAAVKCQGSTGVEMEALTAVSLAALTVYDMCKAKDRDMRITDIHLKYKSGGKSGVFEVEGQGSRVKSQGAGDEVRRYEDTRDAECRTIRDSLVTSHESPLLAGFKAAVLVLSDSTYKGERQDTSGKWLAERLLALGAKEPYYEVLPDEAVKLQEKVKSLCDEDNYDLIVTSGGTGLGPKDFTPESLRALLDKEVPGLAEGMRSFGAQKTPFAWLSRSIAGVRGKSLIISLPGSLKGVQESWEAVEPLMGHALQMMRGEGH